MEKYWNKLKLEIVEDVRIKTEIAGENKDFIEAAILQATIVEAALRMVITTKVGSRSKSFKKYWDGRASFSQLIDYYELSGGKKLLIKRLREYNHKRNDIVHHVLRYSNIFRLVSDAKYNYRLGKRLVNWLFRETGLM